jgi:hypothetical protein
VIKAGDKSSAVQPANEGAGTPRITDDQLRLLAVYPFVGFNEAVLKQAATIEAHGTELTLEQTSLLMRNVQAAQSNLTIGLNGLSSYRRVVSKLLEEKRRAEAAARKAAIKPKQQSDLIDTGIPGSTT